MNTIGLDIGTTTVCAIVVDSDSGKVLKSVTVKNDSFIKSCENYEKLQNPEIILNKCTDLLDSMIKDFSPIACIGISGQMHGILYLDKDGNAQSPLYIWQDGSGNEAFNENETFASHLSAVTGHKMASGFGGTTFYCHTVLGKIPENAVKFCTVHDYVGMKLTGRKTPLTHTSDAASFGLFDLESFCFDTQAIEKANLDFSFFPEVTGNFDVIGEYNGIPVSVALGDNQASFLGSVSDMESSILINMGTGGQISYFTANPVKGVLETRPCCDNSYIAVGSSLCGGRAFEHLANFLRETAELITGEKVDNVYPAIDAFLSSNPYHENPLEVSTRFDGSRENPEERGFVKNIGIDNFTPGHLITGVLDGMVDELKSMYTEKNPLHKTLVGSGNGIRKNPALAERFSSSFGMPIKIPSHNEEAAFGAALSGMTACSLKKSISEAQKLISYK